MGEAKRRGTYQQRKAQAMEKMTVGLGQPGKMVQVNLTEQDTTEIECECGGKLFEPAIRLRLLSALSPKNPTGKDVTVRVDVFVCRACGWEIR